MNLCNGEWKKMGFSKVSLWYMKKNARENKPFKVYESVKEKLEQYN